MVELRYVGFDIINSKIITYTWDGNVFVESYATKQIQNYIDHTILVNNDITYLYIYDDGFTHIYMWDSNWVDLNLAYDDVPELSIISAPFLNSNKSVYVSQTSNDILINKTSNSVIGHILYAGSIPLSGENGAVYTKLHNIENNETILSVTDDDVDIKFYRLDIDLNSNTLLQTITDNVKQNTVKTFITDNDGVFVTYLIYGTDTNIKLYKFDNSTSLFNLVQTYTSLLFPNINNIEFVSDNNRLNSYIIVTTGSSIATFINFDITINTLSSDAYQLLDNNTNVLNLSAFSTHDNFGNYLGVSSSNYLTIYKHGIITNDPEFYRHSSVKFNSPLINTSFYNF